MINWRQKLSSRKFWALLAGLMTALMVLMNMPEETIAQVVAVVGAFASVIVYMLAEASVDAAREKGVFVQVVDEVDKPPDG